MGDSGILDMLFNETIEETEFMNLGKLFWVPMGVVGIGAMAFLTSPFWWGMMPFNRAENKLFVHFKDAGKKEALQHISSSCSSVGPIKDEATCLVWVDRMVRLEKEEVQGQIGTYGPLTNEGESFKDDLAYNGPVNAVPAPTPPEGDNH